MTDVIKGFRYIPVCALIRIGQRMHDGAEKHGAYDPLSVQERLDKIFRHAHAVLEGKTDEDHLAAIASNAMFAIRAEEEAKHTKDTQ